MQPSNPNILAERRRGNLFIKLSGPLDRQSAGEISDSIKLNYDGRGNIFINVEKMARMQEDPVERGLLSEVLEDCGLLRDRFFLIGKEGLSICPDGCRVIVRKKRNCCGKCRSCHC